MYLRDVKNNDAMRPPKQPPTGAANRHHTESFLGSCEYYPDQRDQQATGQKHPELHRLVVKASDKGTR